MLTEGKNFLNIIENSFFKDSSILKNFAFLISVFQQTFYVMLFILIPTLISKFRQL